MNKILLFLYFLVACGAPTPVKQLDAAIDSSIDVSIMDAGTDSIVDAAPDAMLPIPLSCDATITFVNTTLVIIGFTFTCSDPNLIVVLNMNMFGPQGTNIFDKILTKVPCDAEPQLQLTAQLSQFAGSIQANTNVVTCTNTFIRN